MENKPLTMNNLRQMDGEPVYVVLKDLNGFEDLVMCVLVEVCDESIYLTNNLGGRSEYADEVEFEEDGIKIYRFRLGENKEG